MQIKDTQTLPPPDAAVMKAIAAGVELPVLDIGDFLAGKPGAREQYAANIRAIQESLGFYMIVNHSVSADLIDEVEQQARKVFALPEDVKETCIRKGHMQGYWPPNSISNVRPGYENEKEKHSTLSGWAFLRERTPDDPKVVANLKHRSMNKWPPAEHVPDFKPTIERYQSEMLALGLKIIPAYAMALGLPPDYFDKDFKSPEWYLRLNHADGSPYADDQMVTTAHSDHSFLTLLPISPVAGLQVRTPQNTWMTVSYIRGGIVVNTGEWLNQISNGRFLATPHRVVRPEKERVSMPFFVDPSDDARNKPAPGALKLGETSRFKEMNWHDFFVSYIDGYTKAH